MLSFAPVPPNSTPPLRIAFFAASLFGVGLALDVGCVSHRGDENAAAPQIQAAPLDGVVALTAKDPRDESRVTLCSGALVEPNLVLTARHCISRSLTTAPMCDATGKSHNGDHAGDDIDPASIAVYTGDHVDPARDVPRARGVRSLHMEGRVLCDTDIAYVVLDRPITDARTLSVRATQPASSGEVLIPIGYGGGALNTLGLRAPRAANPVIAIGPNTDTRTGKILGPREFEVAGATCIGDSGGPAVDSRGQVVGVISRGAGCTSSGNHVYTRVDAFGVLDAAARAAASAARGSLPPSVGESG